MSPIPLPDGAPGPVAHEHLDAELAALAAMLGPVAVPLAPGAVSAPSTTLPTAHGGLALLPPRLPEAPPARP